MDDELATDMKLHILWLPADWDHEAPDARHYDEYPESA